MKFLAVTGPPLAVVFALSGSARSEAADPAPPIQPSRVIKLFNGENLDGMYTWLKDSKHKDPHKAFRVTDKMIHVTGKGRGYLATRNRYKNFHLIVEYRWGKKTDGGKYVRNSGILLHGVGPDGAAGGVWMTSIECQLAQGCEGDFILIRGKDAHGRRAKASITSDTRVAADGRTRWHRGGKKTVYSGRQMWWSKHDPQFKELLDTRGRWDVASPRDQWTRIDCICGDGKVTIRVNGTTVNQCYDVTLSDGKILLQNEGHEIFFRKFELHPLEKNDADSTTKDGP